MIWDNLDVHWKIYEFCKMILAITLVIGITYILITGWNDMEINISDEGIEKIKDIKIKTELKNRYNKNGFNENLIKEMLKQKAKEEGYITEILPEMKTAKKLEQSIFFKDNRDLPLAVTAAKDKIEKENGKVTVWKNNNIYYLQFDYNLKFEKEQGVIVYQKIILI